MMQTHTLMILILTGYHFLALIPKVLLNLSSMKHELVFQTFKHGYRHKKERILIDPGQYMHHQSVCLHQIADT